MAEMDIDVEQQGGHRWLDRARPTAPPSAERLALMRRTAVIMFLTGGVVCFVGVMVTQRTTFSRQAQSGCAAAFVLCGLVLLVVRPRRCPMQACVVLSVLDLGVLMAISDPIGMGPLFFLWPVVFAAYFFSRRTLVAIFGWMVVCLLAGLLLNTHAELQVDTFIGTTSSVGIMAALVAVMTEREQRLRAELEIIAATDPLTGLLNRRAFRPRLDALAATAAGTSSRVAVVMLDIDHFKRFNDRHGHIVGDLALQRVAEVLRHQSRDGDAVSRFGGEEFAVVLHDVDAAAALAYTERVALALAANAEDPRLRISVSAGISVHALGDDGDTMLARADAALYAAKQAGRARASWSAGDGYVHQRLAGSGSSADASVRP